MRWSYDSFSIPINGIQSKKDRKPIASPAGRPRGALPEMHALVWSQVIPIAGFHAEHVVPGVDIAGRSADAPAVGAMLIGKDPPAQARLRRFSAPHLGEAQEEALVARIAVDHGRGLAI